MPSFLKNTAGGKAISGGALQPRGRRGNTAQVASYWTGGIEVSGAFEQIAFTEVGIGGQTDVTFSSIPQTYKHLQLRFLTKSSGGYYNCGLRFNGDSATNYQDHFLYTNTVSALATGTPNTNYIGLSVITPDYFSAGVVDIFDYTNTNKNKVARGVSGVSTNTAGYCFLSSGAWRSNSAITSLTFTSANVRYSHVALYGIKG